MGGLMVLLVLGALVLYIIQTFLPSLVRYLFGPGELPAKLYDALAGRDAPPAMPKVGGRAARALTNMQEAMFVFLPLALISIVIGSDSLAVIGASVWLGARVFYVPAYLSAIPGVRTVIWGVSVVGLGVMASSVLLNALVA